MNEDQTMTTIYYGNDLTKKLGKKQAQTASTSAEPQAFSTWFIAPLTINRKPYYLHVEAVTGFPVVTKALTPKQFARVFHKTIDRIDYLTDDQKFQIESLTTEKLTYDYAPTATNLMLTKYQQHAAQHPEELEEALAKTRGLPRQDSLSQLSFKVLQSLGVKQEILLSRKLIKFANSKFADKPGKPKPTVKYVTTTPQFDDPRKWEKYEWQPVDQHPKIVQQIQHNNLQAIAQYVDTLPSSYRLPLELVMDFLNDFLNRYLFIEWIILPTTSLAEANAYYYSSMTAQPENYEMYTEMLTGFFRFLSKTGIIRKSDSQRVNSYIKHTSKKFLGYSSQREQMTYTLKQLSSLIENNPDAVQTAIEQMQNGDEPDLTNFFDQPAHPAKTFSAPSNQTYELRAKLNDFHPSTWRRFVISGDASLADLEEAMIFIFHGQFEHLYDLRNERTNEVFELPEAMDEMFSPFANADFKDATKTNVSSLKLDDRLLFTYDFGDSWEFTVHVRKITNEPGPATAQVLSGKGYGIIEDIGGVGALQEYYDDYKAGHVDPDLKEWMGESLIDLNQFDKNEINDLLRGE
jgi:hypothetical protein